ncbi:hypothetical protein DRQ07_06885 [candidate division KSB1 bacterium]|nr:MAG: hypothetical protein DRQ07_06885 [candidate division KSB1 bacterium]
MLFSSDVFIVGIIFGSILMFVKLIADTNIKNKLIEKGMLDENVKYLYTGRQVPGASSIKWGLVLISVGLAYFVAFLFPDNEIRWQIAFGLMILCGGIALIAFYFIAKKMEENNRQE